MEHRVQTPVTWRIVRPRCCSAPVLRFIGAVLCIALSVAAWVALAESLQGLFTKYKQPYFLSYWVHAWYSIMYVIWQVWKQFPGKCRCNAVGDGLLSWKRAAVSSGILAVVGMLSGYSWYISLSNTSVSANTAIYQSSIAFTFILSVPILRERVTAVKVIAVVFSVGGVVLISIFSEKDQGKNDAIKETPGGYIALVISTVLYALWEVLYKKIATVKEDPAAVQNGARMVGLMGVHILFWMWPPIVILNYWIEPFEWPSLWVFQRMFLNAFLDILFNVTILMAISLSSPLFASIGTVTAIPVSIVVDLVINREVSPFLVYLGMALIAIAFIGFCISEFVAARRESQMKQQVMHREGILSRPAADSAIAHNCPDTHAGQTITAENSQPQPSHPSVHCKDEEAQPLLDTPTNAKWTKTVIKYIL